MRGAEEETPEPPVWVVYLLRCNDGSLYTGITNDLDRRLAAHKRGVASKYTRARLPLTLVYQEPHSGRSSASKREASIKKMTRIAKLKLIRAPNRGQKCDPSGPSG